MEPHAGAATGARVAPADDGDGAAVPARVAPADDGDGAAVPARVAAGSGVRDAPIAGLGVPPVGPVAPDGAGGASPQPAIANANVMRSTRSWHMTNTTPLVRRAARWDVELRGIEPLASSMRPRRSTN